MDEGVCGDIHHVFIMTGSKVFGIVLLLSPSLWAFPSLFFTKDEINVIHSIDKKTEESSDMLHLSAIIYVNKDHWSLWLNHKLIQSNHPCFIDGLHIEHITPHTVTFSWNPPNASKPSKFTLRPNQRFLLKEVRGLP